MSGVLDLYGLASFLKKIKIKIYQDLSRFIKIKIKNTEAEEQNWVPKGKETEKLMHRGKETDL